MIFKIIKYIYLTSLMFLFGCDLTKKANDNIPHEFTKDTCNAFDNNQADCVKHSETCMFLLNKNSKNYDDGVCVAKNRTGSSCAEIPLKYCEVPGYLIGFSCKSQGNACEPDTINIKENLADFMKSLDSLSKASAADFDKILLDAENKYDSLDFKDKADIKNKAFHLLFSNKINNKVLDLAKKILLNANDKNAIWQGCAKALADNVNPNNDQNSFVDLLILALESNKADINELKDSQIVQVINKLKSTSAFKIKELYVAINDKAGHLKYAFLNNQSDHIKNILSASSTIYDEKVIRSLLLSKAIEVVKADIASQESKLNDLLEHASDWGINISSESELTLNNIDANILTFIIDGLKSDIHANTDIKNLAGRLANKIRTILPTTANWSLIAKKAFEIIIANPVNFSRKDARTLLHIDPPYKEALASLTAIPVNTMIANTSIYTFLNTALNHEDLLEFANLDLGGSIKPLEKIAQLPANTDTYIIFKNLIERVMDITGQEDFVKNSKVIEILANDRSTLMPADDQSSLKKEVIAALKALASLESLGIDFDGGIKRILDLAKDDVALTQAFKTMKLDVMIKATDWAFKNMNTNVGRAWSEMYEREGISDDQKKDMRNKLFTKSLGGINNLKTFMNNISNLKLKTTWATDIYNLDDGSSGTLIELLIFKDKDIWTFKDIAKEAFKAYLEHLKLDMISNQNKIKALIEGLGKLARKNDKLDELKTESNDWGLESNDEIFKTTILDVLEKASVLSTLGTFPSDESKLEHVKKFRELSDDVVGQGLAKDLAITPLILNYGTGYYVEMVTAGNQYDDIFAALKNMLDNIPNSDDRKLAVNLYGKKSPLFHLLKDRSDINTYPSDIKLKETIKLLTDNGADGNKLEKIDLFYKYLLIYKNDPEMLKKIYNNLSDKITLFDMLSDVFRHKYQAAIDNVKNIFITLYNKIDKDDDKKILRTFLIDAAVKYTDLSDEKNIDLLIKLLDDPWGFDVVKDKFSDKNYYILEFILSIVKDDPNGLIEKLEQVLEPKVIAAGLKWEDFINNEYYHIIQAEKLINSAFDINIDNASLKDIFDKYIGAGGKILDLAPLKNTDGKTILHGLAIRTQDQDTLDMTQQIIAGISSDVNIYKRFINEIDPMAKKTALQIWLEKPDDQFLFDSIDLLFYKPDLAKLISFPKSKAKALLDLYKKYKPNNPNFLTDLMMLIPKNNLMASIIISWLKDQNDQIAKDAVTEYENRLNTGSEEDKKMLEYIKEQKFKKGL